MGGADGGETGWCGAGGSHAGGSGGAGSVRSTSASSAPGVDDSSPPPLDASPPLGPVSWGTVPVVSSGGGGGVLPSLAAPLSSAPRHAAYLCFSPMSSFSGPNWFKISMKTPET